MLFRINHKQLDSLITLIVFVFGIFLTFYYVEESKDYVSRRNQQLAISKLAQKRAALEEALNTRITLSLALEAFAKTTLDLDFEGSEEDLEQYESRFEVFSSSLNNQVPGILSLQLAPAGIVRFISNKERNAQALNHDLLKDENSRKHSMSAIQKGVLQLAGPFELIQGGNAIIARLPIFTEDGAFDTKALVEQGRAAPSDSWPAEIPSNFWGFASVVIDTTTLIRESEADQEPEEFRIGIRGVNGLGDQGEVFFGDPSIFDKPLVKMEVSLPDGKWILGIVNIGNKSLSATTFVAGLGVFTSSILAILLNFILKRNQSNMLRDQAIEANKAKTQFLSTMSHELRTPIHGILIHAESLQENIYGPLSMRQMDVVNLINKSGQHLLELVNDVLDITRIESHRLVIKKTIQSINEVCEECLGLLNNQALEKKLTLTLIQDPKLPDFGFDARRIKQCIINLVYNSIKFTPESGKITITTLLKNSNSRKQTCQISVKDTGVGISNENQQLLFQPFRQVDADLNREYEGVGLGLYITKSIVELHDGAIEVKSKPGSGSCFTISLPVTGLKSEKSGDV